MVPVTRQVAVQGIDIVTTVTDQSAARSYIMGGIGQSRPGIGGDIVAPESPCFTAFKGVDIATAPLCQLDIAGTGGSIQLVKRAGGKVCLGGLRPGSIGHYRTRGHTKAQDHHCQQNWQQFEVYFSDTRLLHRQYPGHLIPAV